MRLLQNCIFLDLFVGLSSYFHCCIVKCCFMWFVIMCVYYTVPFVTNFVWPFKVVWLRITDEHTVVANSPATCGSHREETLQSPASSHHPRGICTKNFHHHHPRSLNLHKIVNWFVRAYFIYRANCLYKENNTMYITDITDIQGEDISYKLWKLVSNPIVVIKDNKICLNYITVFVDLWTIIFYCELQ